MCFRPLYFCFMLWIKTHTSQNISGVHGQSKPSLLPCERLEEEYAVISCNLLCNNLCSCATKLWCKETMHFKQVSLTDNSLSSDFSPWKSLLQIHNIFSILCKHWKFHELFLKVSCSAEWLSVIGGMFNGLTWPPEAKPNVKIKYLNCMLALRFLIWNVQKWAVPPFIRLKLGYSPNF